MPDELGEGHKPPPPYIEGAENMKEQKFSNAVNEGINHALSTIQKRFENPDKPEDKLAFHERNHSTGVVKGVEDILTAINKVNPDLVSIRDIQLGRLIAANHDTVQAWEEKQVPDPNKVEKIKRLRQRKIRENEKASAEGTITYMKKVNADQGEEIFTQQDMNTADEAIMLTVPNFDVQKGTVTHPGFGKKSIIAQALALSDLAHAGRENLEDTKHAAAAILVEENLDIADLNEVNIQSMSPEDQEWYKDRIIRALKFEPRFIEGRKAQTAEDIASMHPDAQKALVGFFPNFDSNADGMRKFADAENAKTLPELLKDIQNILNPPINETEAIIVSNKIDLDDPDASVQAIAADKS